MKDLKKLYPIGTKLQFISGNFMGLSGVVKKVNTDVKNTPYGFLIEVDLSNGKTGYVEKSEHFKKIKT